MADDFDAFLSEALTLPDGEADRAFVRRVQAQIRLDDHLRAERRGMFKLLAIQVLGVAALAVGAFWISRSPAVAGFAGESPAILLTVLLAAFSFVILLFSERTGLAEVADKRTKSFQ